MGRVQQDEQLRAMREKTRRDNRDLGMAPSKSLARRSIRKTQFDFKQVVMTRKGLESVKKYHTQTAPKLNKIRRNKVGGGIR